MKNLVDKPIFEALCGYQKVACAGGRSFSGPGSTLDQILTSEVNRKHTIQFSESGCCIAHLLLQ